MVIFYRKVLSCVFLFVLSTFLLWPCWILFWGVLVGLMFHAITVYALYAYHFMKWFNPNSALTLLITLIFHICAGKALIFFFFLKYFYNLLMWYFVICTHPGVICVERWKKSKVRDSLGKRRNVQVHRELRETRERERLSRRGGVTRKWERKRHRGTFKW